jgi:hypothetical protein
LKGLTSTGPGASQRGFRGMVSMEDFLVTYQAFILQSFRNFHFLT